MQPLSTIRNWQFDELRKSVSVVGFIVQNASGEAIRTYRDGGDGWTVLEVLCHLRDFEDVFFQRARLTLEQDQPELPFPNPDQLAVEHHYNQQDGNRVLEAWSKQRALSLAALESVDEADWSREAKHPVRGLITLMDQLLLMTWHDMNHIAQMIHILSERKS